jgi:hypothetical protein
VPDQRAEEHALAERAAGALLLRDAGSPADTRWMDDRDDLLLSTDYETMSSLERFSFAGPNVRLRTSTVEGLSNTASFCVETRCGDGDGPDLQDLQDLPAAAGAQAGAGAPLSPLGW